MPKGLEDRNLWLSVISRDNILDHKDIMVCEDDWPADYSKVIYYGKEQTWDPSSVFLCDIDCFWLIATSHIGAIHWVFQKKKQRSWWHATSRGIKK